MRPCLFYCRPTTTQPLTVRQRGLRIGSSREREARQWHSWRQADVLYSSLSEHRRSSIRPGGWTHSPAGLPIQEQPQQVGEMP
jgi:hypothetical protein